MFVQNKYRHVILGIRSCLMAKIRNFSQASKTKRLVTKLFAYFETVFAYFETGLHHDTKKTTEIPGGVSADMIEGMSMLLSLDEIFP